MEHIPFIDFHAGLIKGVDSEQVRRHRAGSHEEVEEVPQLLGIHLIGFQNHAGDFAFFDVGFQGP